MATLKGYGRDGEWVTRGVPLWLPGHIVIADKLYAINLSAVCWLVCLCWKLKSAFETFHGIPPSLFLPPTTLSVNVRWVCCTCGLSCYLTKKYAASPFCNSHPERTAPYPFPPSLSLATKSLKGVCAFAFIKLVRKHQQNALNLVNIVKINDNII